MIAVRPSLQFALLAAVVVTIEITLVASQAPQPMVRAAVLADLCAVVPFAWWMLVVRRGAAGLRSVGRVTVLSIGLAGILLGWNLRVLTAPLELLLIAAAIVALRSGGSLAGACVALLGDNAAAHAVAAELTVLRFAIVPARPPENGFTSHRRAGWSAIAAALVLATIAEALALHFLLRRFGATAAFVGVALHVYAVLWFIGDARAMTALPTVLDHRLLRVRIGLRWEAAVPLAHVLSASEERAPKDALKLRIVGEPNLVLRLSEPVEVRGLFGIRKHAKVLALQLDEPGRLARALELTR